VRIFIAIALVTVTVPAYVHADAGPGGPVQQADIFGSIGWLGHRTRNTEATYAGGWNNRGLFGVGTGWYWTDHLRIELEVSRTNEGESWATFGDPRGLPIPPRFIYERRLYRDTTLSLGQVWQFGENATAHPFVTGGVDLAWERLRRERTTTDSEFGNELMLERTSVTRLRPRMFVGAGLKLYAGSRGFVRTDVRVAAGGGGFATFTWRLGAGVDF
jgi:hypothetical protein